MAKIEFGIPPEQYDLSEMNEALVLKLATSYLKIDWLDKAIRLCTEATMIFPNRPEITFMLAQCYFKKGDFDEADLLLKEVFKLSPYHVEARTLMAELEDKLKIA